MKDPITGDAPATPEEAPEASVKPTKKTAKLITPAAGPSLVERALAAHRESRQPELEAEQERLTAHKKARHEALVNALTNLGFDDAVPEEADAFGIDGLTFTVIDGPDGIPEPKLFLWRVNASGGNVYHEVTSLEQLGQLVEKGIQ